MKKKKKLDNSHVRKFCQFGTVFPGWNSTKRGQRSFQITGSVSQLLVSADMSDRSAAYLGALMDASRFFSVGAGYT